MYTVTGIRETEKTFDCISTEKKNIVSAMFFAWKCKLQKYEVTIETSKNLNRVEQFFCSMYNKSIGDVNEIFQNRIWNTLLWNR